MSIDFCTIVSKNYLAYARALGESIRRYHPESRFFVCLADRVDGAFDPDAEPFVLIQAEELEIPEFSRFAFGYSVIEMNTAVKPWVLGQLFDRFGVRNVVYLDPDILLFHRLEPVERALETSPIVLTPHLTSPYPDDRRPTEIDILRAGTYNLGFIALRRGDESARLLEWWRARLVDGCRMDPVHGYHVDQKWIDLVPGLFDGVHIARDKGLNVAYWNLHDREVRIGVDGAPRLGDGSPLYFFHFSGYDPRLPNGVSKHQDRHEMETIGEARELFDHFGARLLANGFTETVDLPYAFSCFDNGESIPADLRRGYLIMGATLRNLGDPFAASGKLYSWWRSERDKYEALEPVTARASTSRGIELSREWMGVNLAGYLRAETGVGEVARGMARALRAAGVPCALNPLWDLSARNEVDEFRDFADGNPHPTNLIHVNADSVEEFAAPRSDYLGLRHNVGYWCWELPEFPARWRDCFRYFDAIWTLSRFARDAIARQSPIPVRVVPPPVAPEIDLEITRAELGLPEDRFIFAFAFDYHSFIERKNPMGVVRAFRQAFGDDPRMMLVIKSARGEKFPEEAARLRALCQPLPNVRLIDAVWSRSRAHSLIGLCDAYVSLHRSEGFGFLMAEAMALGKPVIATAYSGNLDFMNTGNSLLCRYALTELERDHGPYRSGAVWAEPDLDHASELMRQLVSDATLVKRLGLRAAREMASRFTPVAIGKLVSEELTRLLTTPALPKFYLDKSSDLPR